MGISQITSAVMVFVTGLLPASCHKQDTKKAPPAALVAGTTNSAVMPVSGVIGAITLTNKSDTCVEFANGTSCTLTPRIIDHGNLRITVAVESRNDFGDTKDFSVLQVTSKQGKPTDVAIGSMNLSFTPTVVEN